MLVSRVLSRVLSDFVSDLSAAAPRVLSGLVFLLIAGGSVKLLLWALRRFLGRALPGEAPVYRRFVVTIVGVFLWFGVLLSFLSIVGLGAIAAALGTASGFVALGVAYAVSGMIEDAVAGVYLLRDPDFNPGDHVAVDGTEGTVVTIELRKTRFDVDDDRFVLGNADIEDEWTKLEANPALTPEAAD